MKKGILDASRFFSVGILFLCFNSSTFISLIHDDSMFEVKSNAEHC